MKTKNPTKKFDSVKFMRESREKINKEIEGMTSEQIIAYFKTAKEKFNKTSVTPLNKWEPF